MVEAARRGETVRVAGAGHSFAPLCATNGTLLDLSRLAGVERIDAATGEATIWAGTRIADLGEPLLAQGRAFANQGDIDRQAIAGAVSTGTHGTGRKHGSFSAAVRAVELMRPDGELVTIDTTEPERLRAASLSLGLLGVLTRVTLATVPAYKLRERTQALPFDDCLDGFLAEETSRRNAEFWWLPAHDRCVLKTFVETDEEPVPDRSAGGPPRHDRALPQTGRGRLELAHLPLDANLPLRRDGVHPAAGRGSGGDARDTPAHADPPPGLHLGRRVPHAAGRAEPAQPHAGHGERHHQPAPGDATFPMSPSSATRRQSSAPTSGRPHWGKLHFLSSDEIADLYPELPAFRAIRAEMDPRESVYERLSGEAGIGGR